MKRLGIKSRGWDIWTASQALIWVIVLILLVWPLSSIVTASFTSGGHFSLDHYGRILSEPRFLTAIGNTFLVGLGGMCGALVLGVTLAFVVTRYAIRGRKLIEMLALLALVSPPFIGAYAWIVLFGANGSVRRGLMEIGITIPPIYGAAGVIMVFSLKFFPNVFLITSGAFAGVSRSLEEAAESLGVSPARRVLLVTFPLVLPAITASGLLAFVLSIADFGTPQIIGRSFQVLATQAFTMYAADLGSDQGLASAISLVLVLISMILMLAQRRLLRRDIYHNSGMKPAERKPVHGWHGIMLHVVAYSIVLIGTIPAIVAIVFSFRRTRGPVFQPGFSLQSYTRIIETVPDAITNTVIFSACAVVAIVVIGTVLGTLLARRPSLGSGALDGLMMVPYVVPGVVMGIAYVATFNGPPLVLTGTGLIIVLSIFIRRLPYTARAVSTALRQISPSLEEAAMSLGLSPGRAFMKVTVPLILPGIVAGGLISLVTAMNELSSSLVLYVGGTITMPVRIYVAVIDGDYGTAAALSAILITLTAIAISLASRLSKR